MTESRPIGRWLDTVTAKNTVPGDLVWPPVERGGLGTRIATMAGREFAVLRPLGSGPNRQWNVRVEGFVWFADAMPEKSVAGMMGFKESKVGGFPSIAKAKAAVAEVRRLLDEHLRQHAA